MSIVIQYKVEWFEHCGDSPEFVLTIPEWNKIRREIRYDIKYCQFSNESGAMLHGENQGIVSFMYHNYNNQTGCGGSTHNVILKNGTLYKAVGPWSSRASLMNLEFDIPCSEISAITGDGYRMASNASLPLLREAAERCNVYLMVKQYENDGEFFFVPSTSAVRLKKPNGNYFDFNDRCWCLYDPRKPVFSTIRTYGFLEGCKRHPDVPERFTTPDPKRPMTEMDFHWYNGYLLARAVKFNKIASI